MGLKIKKIWKLKPVPEFLKNTTWHQILAGVVYFLLFTILLSSGLFASKLDIRVGLPSPQDIPAPWDKDFEDMDKWYADRAAAAKATQPVYMPDEGYISSLAGDLSKAFLALNETVNSNLDQESRVNKLRQTAPFAGVPDGTLASLTKASAKDISKAEQAATEIIIGRSRNMGTGARVDANVAPLRDKMKEDVSKTNLSGDFKVFLQAFIDTKVNHPTLVIDEEATNSLKAAAEAAVKLEVHRYKTNEKIIGKGEIVDENNFRVLEAYGLVDDRTPWRSTGGIAIIVLIGMGAIFLHVYHYKRSILQSTGKMALMGLTMALVLIIGKGTININMGGAEYNALAGILIPAAWATMSITILIDVEVALLASVILAVFTAILVDPTLATSFGLQVGLVSLAGGIVGVHSVSHLSQRSDLARAGIFISATNVLAITGVALMSGMHLTVWAVGALLAIVNGLASSVLTVGTLHWFESGFHITSAIHLLEISNPNRPLLKRLLMEAPGTYHHSILVGNLAEAAAEAVHADAALVRVGAMYHDIGKLKRPYFFIENQFAQDNPHDRIAPTLSSLIITSHIKDGLELAKEYKLPEPIQNIIAQHHGDSLVSFFYHKALEENPDAPEEAFHYEGPRPQSKEAALVSLADSVEAAVRSMKQPTPGRIEGLVRKLIKDKLNDGQLDQSDLTLQDLDRIAIAFVRVLSGIFHSRVEYPTFPVNRATNTEGGSQKRVFPGEATQPAGNEAYIQGE